MKKNFIALCAVLALTISTAFAQGGDEKKERTNYFMSKPNQNWFINIEGSINWWGGSDKLSFKNEFGDNSHIFNPKDFGFGGSLSFGKWITHKVALRLAYDVHQSKTWLPGNVNKNNDNGYMFNNLTEKDFFTDFDGYDGVNGYADVKFMFHNIHADVMFNLAGVFSGKFNPKRVYTPVLYAGGGLGYVTQNITKKNWYDIVGAGKMENKETGHVYRPNYEFTFNAGFMNVFRLSKSLDLHFDLQYMLTVWGIDSYLKEYNSLVKGKETVSRRIDQNLGAAIGLTWTIGGKQFDSPSACDNSEYEKKNSDLEKDLNECNKNLDECTNNLDECNKSLNESNAAIEEYRKKLVDTDGDGIPDLWDNCPEERGKVENAGCPVREKVSADFDEMINYEVGKADLKPSTYTHLDKLVKILNENPTYMVALDGHTDNTGSDAVNDSLSQKRVDNVKSYLVEKGIDASRITAKGHGSSEPLLPNTSKANRAKNRRTEVRLIHE